QCVAISGDGRAIRSGADDRFQIARGVVLVDGNGAAGNIQAGDVTRIVVAIDGEVAGPVRDAAETAGAIVIVGDLAIARQIDGGQPAGAVPDVAQLVTGSVDGIVDATLRIASHARIDAELRRPGGQSSRTERGAIPDLQSRPGRGCDRA